MAPQLILGTATLGMTMTKFQDSDSVGALLEKLPQLGINRLDTAARYPPLNPGRAEELIGEALARRVTGSHPLDLAIDTKVYTNTATDGSGDLSRGAIVRSLDRSWERFQQPSGWKINVLYNHRPDPTTPLEEQIQAFNEQIEAGKIKNWGVANMPLAILTRILELCDKNGWRKPTCYQGHYSLISRAAEKELLPLLRRHGISFVVYQILEAGFLTAKFVNNDYAGTRMDEENPLGRFVQNAFADETLRAAVKRFDAKVREKGLTSTEVAVRLAVHQLALGENDAVILGASKISQLEETVAMIRRGPLPNEFLEMAEELWDAVKGTRGNKI